jgi:hypothetical protein
MENNNIFTKSEIARMLVYQYPLTEENDSVINKLVKDITNYDENIFRDETLKAGIRYENFGYNRYCIKY